MDYKKYLTDNVLRFWLNNGIDEKFGGIFTCLDKTGSVYGDVKSVWFQGRALWTFSKAYNLIEKNEEYLNAAKKIYEFLPRCTAADGRMFFTVTRDGKSIQKRRYYFSETFAAIGCCEYYKATGDKGAFELAGKYFNTAYGLFKNPSLQEPKFNPETVSLKALSPVMIMLSTAQVMRTAKINTEYYEKIESECITEIVSGGYYQPEHKVLLENVTIDGKFENSVMGRQVNPGHSLEAAWFIMSEAIHTGNENFLEISKNIIEWSMDIGLDREYNGIYAFRDAKGCPPAQLEWDMKLWWPQNEAIIANNLASILLKDEQYKKAADLLESYAMSKFGDDECGEWYGYLHYDGTVANTAKGNIFKGPFHLPRMLMALCAMEKYNSIEPFLA